MTRNEAITQIRAITKNALSDEEIRALVGCTPAELARMIQRYARTEGTLRSRQIWWSISAVQAQLQQWTSTADSLGQALVLLAGVL